jgi:serine/threonine protein kinase
MSDMGNGFQGTSRFCIVRQIGAGGMGVVYEAYDSQRNVRVALKTLLYVDARSLYQFKQEFRALSDVIHPNLVALHEFFSAGEQWFFTMELVHGVNFLEYVRGGVLGPRDSDATWLGPLAPTCDKPPPESQAAALASTRVLSTGDDPIVIDHISLGLQAAGAPAAQWVSERDAVDLSTPPTVQPFDTSASSLHFHADPSTGAELAPSLRPAPLSDPAELVRLRHGLAQLVRGICALHQARKLHRDIKPTNVLVTSVGRVVLLDFGLIIEFALDEADAKRSSDLAGTLPYMSPEQLTGMPLTPAADWYAVGVILYEALTGGLPFTGTRRQIIHAKQSKEPSFSDALANRLPADLVQLCKALLARRAEDRPNGSAILASLTGGTAELATTAIPVSRSAFVGRTAQLRGLWNAYIATKAGHPVTVYVHGPSGMGKSQLLQRFMDELRTREDVIVLAGRCYERESVPYKALDILVDALSRYLRQLPDARAFMPRDAAAMARLFPVLRDFVSWGEASVEAPDPHELRRRAFAALRELLGKLGERRGLLLCIDDLQWGDADSAALLAELVRPPNAPVLCLICAYRSEYQRSSPCLRALGEIRATAAATMDWREVTIGPLSPAEAEELARELLGSENRHTPLWPELIAGESGGNPYLVHELVQYLEAGANLDARPRSAQITLSEVLWSRVTRLPETARALLEVITVSGQPLRQRDAYRAAGLGCADPTPLLELRAAHLVRSSGPDEQDEVETYHDRVRETVTVHLSAEAISSHHRRLAQTLEAGEETDTETLAVHFQACDDKVKAGVYYGLAADKAAEALAFDRAAKLYRLAVDFAPPIGMERRALRTKLADALANAGRGPEAAHEYQALAEETNGADRLELERRAAYQYLISGQLDPGYDAIERVLGRIGVRLPRSPLKSLLWHRGRLKLTRLRYRERPANEVPAEDLARIDILSTAATGLAVADTLRATGLQARHLLLALRVGEPARLARALVREASHLSLGGTGTQRAIDKYLGKARAIASRIDSPILHGLIALAQGETSFFHGQWAIARGHCERAENIFRDHCPGMTWELDSAQSFIGWSLALMGNLAALRLRLPIMIKEARERGDLFLETNLATYAAPFVRLANDDPESSRSEINEVMRRWSRRGVHSQHYMAIAGLTYVDLYEGKGSTAWQRLKSHWTGLRKAFLLHIESIRIDLLQMRIRSGLAAAATAKAAAGWLQTIQADLHLLQRESAPWSVPFVCASRAALAAIRGRRRQASELLAQAAHGFDQTPMRHYACAARRLQGQLQGDRELLSKSDRWMAEQGIQRPEQFTAMLIPGVSP